MLSITVRCVGCGAENEFKNEDVPTEQPFCESCGMPMIAKQAELDTRKTRIDAVGGTGCKASVETRI